MAREKCLSLADWVPNAKAVLRKLRVVEARELVKRLKSARGLGDAEMHQRLARRFLTARDS
jgi:hypothetical protein